MNQAQSEFPVTPGSNLSPSRSTVERLFPTPVYLLEHDDDPLRPLLEHAILERKLERPGIKRSNVGGWHSESNFAQWSGDPGQQLIQRVVDFASSHTIDLATSNPPNQWRVEAWANVNRGAEFNQFHGHGGAFWSAVYYVRIDEESGGLVLADPRYPLCGMHAPGYRFKDMGPQEVALVRPKPGTLVLFPSWLMHAVQPSRSDCERISVAINLSAIVGTSTT